MENIHFDTLIIGCGIAGCTAAFEEARAGRRVALVASSSATWDINSARAQGGIVYRCGEDGMLADDIVRAGGGKCDEAAVRELVRVGPDLVKELLIDELGVPFADRLTTEAAHSCSRILFAQDQTGLAIMQTLLRAVSMRREITFLTARRALELFVVDGACRGAYVLKEGEVDLFTADKTILATGGVGDLYQHTSNSHEAKGDGLALACRAGAELADLAYVQFHPTALYVPGKRCFLLSEALRGEGARLLDSEKKPFMDRYHPDGELAPRDIVARAVYREMNPCVYLDVTHLGKEYLVERFPKIYARCLEEGVDMALEPIPTVPCAHYLCGGIRATLSGRTRVPGLFAIGEVACTGVHGANRLASTSLLEGLVMGKLVAEEEGVPGPAAGEPLTGEGGDDPAVWSTVQNILWEKVGIVRERQKMEEAVALLTALKRTWEKRPLARLCNGTQAALLLAQAAARERESAGAHYLLEV